MSQYQSRTGPITNAAAAFSPEMVQGSQPSTRARIHAAPRIGLPLAQTTHVAAAFSAEMAAGAQGVRFPSPRILLGQKIPLPLSQPTHVQAPFTNSMTAGTNLPSPRILRPPKTLLPDLVFTQAFAFDSVLSNCLDLRNHLTYAQQLPAISQTTHVPAAFSIEMVAGVPVLLQKPRQNQPSLPDLIFTQAFPFESILSMSLDSRNHLTYPKHLQPISQTTHVAAPFSIEMVAGVPVLLPKPRKNHPNLPDLIFTDVFAFESILSMCLDGRNHLTRAQQLQAISQTTHVAAPFSIEMVAGIPVFVPIQRKNQPGLPDLIFSQAFPFESVLSLSLDSRNHLTYPQHLQAISQNTHTPAPFSIETVIQAIDSMARLWKAQQSIFVHPLEDITPAPVITAVAQAVGGYPVKKKKRKKHIEDYGPLPQLPPEPEQRKPELPRLEPGEIVYAEPAPIPASAASKQLVASGLMPQRFPTTQQIDLKRLQAAEARLKRKQEQDDEEALFRLGGFE